MPELIELASLALAIAVGLPVLFLTDSLAISVVIWIFGVIAGIAGSRLAALIRHRQSIQEMQNWAKQRCSLDREH